MFTIPCIRRILLVDEDTGLRTVLGLLLAGEGYDVCQADNGEQAISLFCRRPLDLVITELKLGGKDGFEVIVEMRRELVCARFIAATRAGLLPAAVCSRVAEHLGAHCVLMKPFSPLQFLSAVRCALGETDDESHSFIPTIVVAASRPSLPAAIETAGTFRTAASSGNCTRALRRWHRGMRRIP
jgi:two-component system, response regulator FlrC